MQIKRDTNLRNILQSERTKTGLLLAACLAATARFALGLWPLCILMILVLRTKKIPCKPNLLGVQ